MLQAAKENPDKFFACNMKWPSCKFDFYRQYTQVDEFVFKSATLIEKKIVIISDYFAADSLQQRADQKPVATTTEDLLIDHHQHYCRPDFISNVGKMFNNECPDLLVCPYLFVQQRVSAPKAHEQMRKFQHKILKYDTSKF